MLAVGAWVLTEGETAEEGQTEGRMREGRIVVVVKLLAQLGAARLSLCFAAASLLVGSAAPRGDSHAIFQSRVVFAAI